MQLLNPQTQPAPTEAVAATPPPPERFFHDVLRDTEAITADKMEKAVETFNGQQVVDDALVLMVAGIDLTEGGKRLMSTEFDMIQKNVQRLEEEYRHLQSVVEDFDPIILPKVIFDRIRLNLNLFVVVPHKGTPNEYGVSEEWSQRYTAISSRNYAPIVAVVWAVCVAILFGSTQSFKALLFSLPIGFALYLCSLLWKWQEVQDLKRNYGLLFQKLRLDTPRTSSKDWVRISVPPPSGEDVGVIDRIIALSTHVKRSSSRCKLVTIVDEKAIGIDLHVADRPKPEPVSTSIDEDPGMAVEHGDWVAIIPDTFYNVTPMEEEFIEDVLIAAVSWDAESYVYN